MTTATAHDTPAQDAPSIKQFAAGHWPELLTRLAGIPAEILDGRHHPCPKCGGTDRFRALDDFEQTGAVFCNQCFAEGNGDGISAVQWLTGIGFREALAAITEQLGLNGKAHRSNGHHASANGKRRIVATYDYRDQAGELLYQVCRMEPKDFRQRRPKEGGGWEWRVKGMRLVPYRLPELLTADPAALVLIVEGEKDVDRLTRLGLLATCNAGGAGKWRSEYSERLRGRRVAILPDNDDPGRKHAHEVAQSLRGVAASVRVVELPGLPEKGDVSDWLDTGGTVDDLLRLVEEAPEWEPAAPSETKPIIVGEGELLLTDLGNARRFVAQHAHRARFCHPWGKWLIWDGRRWAVDQTGAAERLAKETARSILAEASREPDKDRQRELIKFATASQSIARLTSMLRGAQSELEIAILPGVLDVDPWLLNVENGTIDLRTLELKPHRQADMITKLAPVAFDPAATCPTWERAVLEAAAARESLVGFRRRLAGYCLTGSVRDHVLAIFYGNGGNGKSTDLETMLALMGEDYAIKGASDILLAKKGSHPTERADLFGKRLVICVETEGNRRLAESLVKELSGGDTIRARKMREDFWQFRPTHKIILATNHKPVVHGTDNGIWRRLKLVPFDVSFEGQEDRELPEKLKAELPGILNWCLAGCVEWQDAGLGEPDEVRDATAAYRGEQDVIAAFLDELCVRDPAARVRSKEVYATYRKWCEETGEQAASLTRFGSTLVDRGVEKDRSNGVWYIGIGLKLEHLP